MVLCLTIILIKQFRNQFDRVNGNIEEKVSPIRMNMLLCRKLAVRIYVY